MEATIENINNELNRVYNLQYKEDCDVWVDLLSGNTACLAWHTFMDIYIDKQYLHNVVSLIFKLCKTINKITTPFGDFRRKQY